MARQNNWRLIRNNKINTKDEMVWLYHTGEKAVALAKPSLASEGGFSHWKRKMDWEPDPGNPDKDDLMKAEAQDILDRMEADDKELDDIFASIIVDDALDLIPEEDNDDDLPW